MTEINGVHPADWTANLALLVSPDHLRLLLSASWEKTELGAISEWSPVLQAYVQMCMSDGRPGILYLGKELLGLYNEAYIPLLGAAHPNLMGAPFRTIFESIWKDMEGVFSFALSSKKAVDIGQTTLIVNRSGYLEETVFDGNFNPLVGDQGVIIGVYNTVIEVTRAALMQRRTTALNAIACPKVSYTTSNIGNHIIDCLSVLDKDIPAAILYRTDEEKVAGRTAVYVSGSIGIPENHSLKQDNVFLDQDKGIMPLLRQANDRNLTLKTPECFEKVTWGGFGVPSTHVSIVPCIYAARIYGYLVFGTNPRRLIDEDHEQFLVDLSQQISITMSNVVSREEDAARHKRLERDLAESERKITYIAKHAHVALMYTSLKGQTLWANDYCRELLGISADTDVREITPVFLDEVNDADGAWHDLIEKGKPLYNHSTRIKALYTPPNGPPEPSTIMISAFPYLQNGEVQHIMCCMIDVSALSWAEKWQARSAEEAKQANARQNEFIDLLSHEIRNPLGAIYQLSDSITSSAEKASYTTPIEDMISALNEAAESAKTILMCAKHQKRIVDDVLTLSRLNFTLLTLTPSAVSPTDLLAQNFKMFAAEIQKHDITLTIIADDSYARLEVDQVLCDPSRVTQVLINLTTNAIKFTREKSTKKITVRYGARTTEPREAFTDRMYWVPRVQGEAAEADAMQTPEWGTGQEIFLTFSVEDTGTGMKQNEIKKLCTRFQQANQKTQVKYGGSGLGLFISRRLVQKMGGNMCLMSELNQGSTFGFYIKVRRCETAPSIDSSRKSPVQQILSSLELPTRTPLPVVAPSDEIFRSCNTVTTLPKERKPTPIVAPNIHVLLVEDNLINQQILRRQLVKLGCIVHVANHGVEALDLLEKSDHWHSCPESNLKLEIILLDWEMPVMDGLTCAREVRSREEQGLLLRHIPIIATTANSRAEQIERALDAGIDEVLTKPFATAQLMERIRKRLGEDQ